MTDTPDYDALWRRIHDAESDDWAPISPHGAGHLLSEPTDAEGQGALADAKDVVADLLADGPMAAKDLKRRVMDEDVSERTFRRARQALGCVKRKAGMRGGWTWELPANLATEPRRCPPSDHGHLRDSWPPSDAATLHAEFDRMRAENARLASEMVRLGREADDEPTAMWGWPR